MVSVARQQALRTAGALLPPPVFANLLVDTGASCTNIDLKFVAALGLTPTGSVPVHTPSTGATPVVQQLYDIGLAIISPPGPAGSGHHFVPNLPVLATDLSAQNLDGLLGRDVLRMCRMTYSGPDNLLMLSF
jgi:hypothetical protein